MISKGKRSFISLIVGFLILSTVLKNLKVARTLAIFSFSGLVLAGMAGTGAAVSGMVAEWHFNGSAQDTSGSDNHGTINGATFVQGISGQALSFDGVDDMVVVPHSPSLSLDKFTMEAWIKIKKIREFGSQETILIKRYEPSWQDNYGLAISSKGKVEASFYSFDIPTWFNAKSVINISAGDWYHIAATYDRTTLKIYINGVLDNSVNTKYTPYQNNFKLVIGRACAGDPCLFRPSSPSFNGIIDEVRIYNRALSASEIQAEYNLTSTPTSTPTATPALTPTVQPTSTPLVLPSTTEEYKKLKEKFEIALKNFRDIEDRLKVAEAKFIPQAEQFKSEKEAFKSIKESLIDKERDAQKAELQRKEDEIKLQANKLQELVKEFLERRIDLQIANIELLKYDAKFTGNGEALPFDASATLDKHIMELEQIRKRVQQASNKLDIKDIKRDLKDIKEKFALERRYYKGIRVNNHMETFFARTDDASVRMEELIKKHNENGKDTSKLTGIASDFNNLMNQAKDKHNKTIVLYRDHPGFDSAGMVTDIRNAQDFIGQIREQQTDTKILRDAIAELREFFGETKRLIKGTQESATPVTGGANT